MTVGELKAKLAAIEDDTPVWKGHFGRVAIGGDLMPTHGGEALTEDEIEELELDPATLQHVVVIR